MQVNTVCVNNFTHQFKHVNLNQNTLKPEM